jgi:hypothetical protein
VLGTLFKMKNASRTQPRSQFSLKLTSPQVMMGLSPRFKPLTSRARLLPLTSKPSLSPPLTKQNWAPDTKKMKLLGAPMQEDAVSGSASASLGYVDILPEVEQCRDVRSSLTLNPQQLTEDVNLFQRELLRKTVKDSPCKFWDPQDSLTIELNTLMLPVQTPAKAVLKPRAKKRTLSKRISLAPLAPLGVLGGPSPVGVKANRTGRTSLHEIITSRPKKSPEYR